MTIIVRRSGGTPSRSSNAGRIVAPNRIAAPRLTSAIATSDAGISATSARRQRAHVPSGFAPQYNVAATMITLMTAMTPR